ncbi:CocE/NonD family hydrolase [Nonomuraea sp. NPDC051941]|uniref:CocE/NonD family hydrolase n=1 Tax=Nonomuraea sp. NPDC051941 TaxID=3364373 RepID=UPI0037CC1A53
MLVRTPYGKHELDAKGTARVPGRRGMRVFVQNVRGAFGSGGRFAAFQQEREDGLSAGAWLPRAGVVRRAAGDGGGQLPGYTHAVGGRAVLRSAAGGDVPEVTAVALSLEVIAASPRPGVAAIAPSLRLLPSRPGLEVPPSPPA